MIGVMTISGVRGAYRVISEPRYVDALTGVLRP